MKAYTHIIWDFNGTILNDVQVGIDSANRLLAAHSLPRIASVEEYREKFGFPIIEYYRRMGFDFDVTPYADLAVEWVSYYLEYKKNTAIFCDIPDVLRKLKKKGLSQLILSATETEMLEGQVRELGIRDYFDTLLGLGNIHAYSKQEIGCKWMAEHPDAVPLMIGDTDHDAEVAAAMGVDCVLLSCGHQSREKLEKCRCLFVADSATETLERVFESRT